MGKLARYKRVIVYRKKLRSTSTARKKFKKKNNPLNLRDTPARLAWKAKKRRRRRRKLKRTEELILKVFLKGKKVEGLNPKEFRMGKLNRLIKLSEYGGKGRFSWQIDHSKPWSKGGTDHLNNLQPLHWKSNILKSNIYPFKYPQPSNIPLNGFP